MSEDSDSNLTQHDIDAIAVKVGGKNDDLGKFFRKNLVYLFAALSALGGTGGVAFYKFGPDAVQENARNIERNSIKIENLGLEAVNTQEQIVQGVTFQEKNTAAIMETIVTGKATKVEKPKALQELEAAVEKRAKKAKAGKLLEVSDADLDKAMEAKK